VLRHAAGLRADVRVARIFNTYGPRMQPDDGRIVSNLIVQALSASR
jgi:UDP-glucuronate decarboxylase